MWNVVKRGKAAHVKTRFTLTNHASEILEGSARYLEMTCNLFFFMM